MPWFSVYPSNNISPLSASLFSASSDGLAAFRAFLRTEFSEENLDFWLACEDYKKIKSQSKMTSKAKKIFAEFIAIQSCKEVSMRSRVYLNFFTDCKRLLKRLTLKSHPRCSLGIEKV